MHFSNYISRSVAESCVRKKIKRVSLTPTALKQTPEANIRFLEENGVEVREVRRSGRPRRLSEGEVKRVLTIRREGNLSFSKIANLTNIPKSTVFDYCKRYEGKALETREVRDLQIKEARRVLKELLSRDLDEEINELARRGCGSGDVEEIEKIIREINEIIYYS
jgi:transposase